MLLTTVVGTLESANASPDISRWLAGDYLERTRVHMPPREWATYSEMVSHAEINSDRSARR